MLFSLHCYQGLVTKLEDVGLPSLSGAVEDVLHELISSPAQECFSAAVAERDRLSSIFDEKIINCKT